MIRYAWLIGLLWLAASPGWSADEPLGRLFFSPAQRAALEEARRKNIQAEELALEAARKPKVPRARQVTINGLITRSDGASVIWVNGKPVEGQTADGLRVSPSTSRGSVVLSDAEKGRALRLKVGQRANLLTGAVEENYEARRAEAHAEEAAREAGSGQSADKSSQRRPRKRAPPDDEPPAPTAAKVEPPPATEEVIDPGTGIPYMPRATTLPAGVADQTVGAGR